MNAIAKIESLFKDLEDDVLDEYNKGTISKKEMINILAWCEKMKEIQKNNALNDIE